MNTETNGSDIWGSQVKMVQASMSDGRMMELICTVCVLPVIGVFGIAANLINIIVFFKQGFTDSVNISFCALAISDLGAIIPLLWRSLCSNPLFQNSDIEFDPVQVLYISAGWPHGCFVRITSWITAFVTFERCVCIALPLKVKDIITPKRTLISLVAIFAAVIVSAFPAFFAVKLTPSFNVQRNRTLFGFPFTEIGLDLENTSFYINVFQQLSSFATVIVCTVILINSLIAVSKWRHNSHTLFWLKSESMSIREKKVVKLVTSISCIFIVCLLPGCVNMLLTIFLSPDYRIQGRFKNSYQISWAVFGLLEAINSSVSLLVYFNMSSKFRAAVIELFNTLQSCTG